ncbi:MAG TPA: hydrolase 1, exosortase A system-associated [Rubrivivax sp.]|nr:hydrolase 1, exosortase A system-associated [Rubrivivax sp.]
MQHGAFIAAGGPLPQPLIIDGARGPLVAVYHPPAAPRHPGGDLLVVPPFGEEMNRCRQMIALQARALAPLGVGTLVLDPFGTGDSAGEFIDATWDGWRDDLRRGLAWLRHRGQGCETVWGLRLGAVMASELAREDAGLRRLLLWQPVSSGKTFFTQFLRIRIAADLHLPDRVKTTNELRARFADGHAVEVSGYEVGPALAQTIDCAELDALALAGRQVDWFEVLADEETAAPLASKKTQEALRQAGVDLRVESLVGPPFWQVHEREVAPALLEAMARRFALPEWPAVDAAPSGTHVPDKGEAGRADAATEQPLTFDCRGEQLVGVLHRAPVPARRGAIIVIAGGPQYRAGAHRQFVQLARRLAAEGCAVLRFDQRGMGDSTGTYQGFEHIGDDIAAAIDALRSACPEMQRLLLVGECNSASDILFYAWRDRRVTEVALTNPWVRTPEGQAQVIVKTYYLDRLRSREFWALVFSGKFELRRSLRSLAEVLRDYWRGRRMLSRSGSAPQDAFDTLPLPLRTAEGLRRFGGPALVLMSGHDYIAREFDEITRITPAWSGLLDSGQVRRVDIDGADHTFSKQVWKTAMVEAIVDWMKTHPVHAAEPRG